MARLRFNLGRGSRYQKWKVYGEGVKEPLFLDPKLYQLLLYNAKLVSVKPTAEKIHNGAHKSVCAWIEFDSLEVKYSGTLSAENLKPVSYNPKVNPFWEIGGINSDGTTHQQLVTEGNKVFLKSSQTT